MKKHRLRLIGAKWEDYCKSVIPKNAPQIQITESRRAFYAGAQGVMDAMAKQMSDSPDETPNEIAVVQDVMAELDEFAQLIALGKA
jgi:hypothetical protein